MTGREGGIRTRGLPVPNRALYQAEPIPDVFCFRLSDSERSVPSSRTELSLRQMLAYRLI